MQFPRGLNLGLNDVVALTMALFKLVCDDDRKMSFLQYYMLLVNKFGILEMEPGCLFYRKERFNG